ncbi:MAG: 4-hydroxythreonine-4-phosphate dehydrogenase PdxA [Alphaproteobacteria bacterium]|nr:4-hydroxythreonine-4-phosphate dehydrogenase PdxA [Alphaproteobacteria bacterium]
MGDPSGVGPEVIAGALAALPPSARTGLCVVGDGAVMARAARLVGATLGFGEGCGAVPLVPVALADRATIVDGAISAAGGEAAYRAVARAVELALSGAIDAIVTAPLNKAALHAAGHRYDGHTELLAKLTGAKGSFMLLASDKLASIHVSTHVSLLEATRRATTTRVLATIQAGHAHFRELGLAEPRIAVAGLNPHCGEGGLFGREELDEINLAVEMAKGEGIVVSGPLPADTVFHRALKVEFDLVVAQYHDQGHIPTKLVAFDETVNVTLGLPVRRTSVDHGTAFDIAWKGLARPTNMLAAIAYARRMVACAG